MSQSYRVIVLPEAFADIDRIIDPIQQDSPQNAAIVLTQLWDATRTLSIFPHRYKVHQHHRDPAKAVHPTPVPPFIIYYRINEVNRAVRVLTIRHGRQRRPRKFR